MATSPKKLLISVKDIQRISGVNYENARVQHKQIRDSLSGKEGEKKLLTIQEYCDYNGLPFEEINAFLSGEMEHPMHDLED